MILEKLFEKKDLLSYIKYRKQHLELEKQKIPHTEMDDKIKEKAIIKIKGRIKELSYLKKMVEDLKEASKYHYRKANYLKDVKDYHNFQK